MPDLIDADAVATLPDLARLLRQLRRRQARQRGDAPLTHRELAARTGWSHGVIGDYLSGRVLAPTDRFDVLVQLLGATAREQRALATARDRVEEHPRHPAVAAQAVRGRRRDPAGPTPLVPKQLPPATPCFVGRDAALAELDALAARSDAQVAICVITGTAGVGKTTIAVRWSHDAADRFPDGQLYLDLRGFDQANEPLDPHEAVRGFLDAFGVLPARIPATLQAQVGLYRSLLAGRRVLVVLDNARDAAQVRPLLPGSPGNMVLVTGRDGLAGLVTAQGAHPVTLDLLSAGQARELLAVRLGAARIAAEPTAVGEIIDRCARLPLALAVVAARAATRPDFALATLAAQMRTARRELNEFIDADAATDVRTVFSWSYQRLGAPAARLFRLLGLHPGPHTTVPAAASLAGVSVGRVRVALLELVRAHLIAEPVPGRYALHDLLHAYAAELPDAGRDDARRRMFDHYLHSAYAADRLLSLHRDPIALDPPEPGVTVDAPADETRAQDWFTAEHPVLLAAVRSAVEAGFETHACRLAWTLSDFLIRHGHWRVLADSQRAAVAAAGALEDRLEQARAERGLGAAYTRLGRYDDARVCFENALERFESLGDAAGRAHTHLNLAEVLDRLGRHADALAHARCALGPAETTEHPHWFARAVNAVGWYHARLGQYQQALIHCGRSLRLQQAIGDRDGVADSWDSLGYSHHHLNEHELALDCYRQAMRLWRETGNRQGQADTLVNIGDTLAALARHDAVDAWRQALRILEDLGHPDAERVRDKLQLMPVTHPGADSRLAASDTG